MENNRRKMVVYISREFVIRERKIDEFACRAHAKSELPKPHKGKEYPVLFGASRISADNKVAYIFDIAAPRKEEMEALSKDSRFTEQCDFEFFNSYSETIVDGWNGTFIDAFHWIAKNMRQIQREAGDCA